MSRVIAKQEGHLLSKPLPLAVTLPDISSVPDAWRGAKYVIKRLLSAGEDNPKLSKSDKAGTPFKTWGLGLAPAKESGFQLCSSSSRGCRESCLFFQGQARIDPVIVASRLAKTIAWKTRPDWFKARLLHELGVITRRAEENDFEVALRLNLTSDVMWEREFPDVFEQFPSITFYDYSKHFKRMMRFLNGELPGNYHLTFSHNEDNDIQCRDVLGEDGNVAVVFRGRDLPKRYLGSHVIDGDVTDLRFLDPMGVVVGLRAKGTARREVSGFVVDVNTRRVPLVLR